MWRRSGFGLLGCQSERGQMHGVFYWHAQCVHKYKLQLSVPGHGINIYLAPVTVQGRRCWARYAERRKLPS